MSFHREKTLWLGIAFALLSMAGPAQAQSLDAIEIHGFGGWAYGKTDGHKYLIGTEDGQYDNAEFALNVAARPIDRLSIVAQVRFESGNDDQDADLDYAFAEYSFSDAVRVRMGRVKHPFGIYGEVFDVGTIRPFYYLPQSIYGSNGFTARAYNGIGVTGLVPFGSGWAMQYDLYGGQIEGDFETPGLLSTVPELFDQPNITFGYSVDDSIGGRVNLYTPIDGLSFGASAYTGDATVDLEVVSVAKRDVWTVQAEYVGDRFALRGEFGHLKNGTDFDSDSYYVETSYRLTNHWQLAARYDDQDVNIDIDPAGLPAIFPQLLTSTDIGFAVNYWFSPGFVVRAEVHKVEGNRFAYPETSDEVLAAIITGNLDDETTMFVFGAQFSF